MATKVYEVIFYEDGDVIETVLYDSFPKASLRFNEFLIELTNDGTFDEDYIKIDRSRAYETSLIRAIYVPEQDLIAQVVEVMVY